MSDAPGTSWRLGWPALVLLLGGLALTLPGLGRGGLWDPWEPKYAQTAREMSERAHWIVPYYRGDSRLVKPPLTYWMIGGAQAMLGVTETAARLPSALLAALCPAALALAFALRRRPLEGFLAGAALVSSPQWLLLGRFATPDLPFAAWLGGALACVVALPALEGRRAHALTLLVVLLVALATLTEWPRGILVPAWAVLGWAALRAGWKGVLALTLTATLYYVGQQMHHFALVLLSFAAAVTLAVVFLITVGKVSWKRTLVGVMLLVLLVAPWFVAVFQIEPQEAAERLLGYKHAMNLGESTGEHTGPLHYVLYIVLLGGLPWSAVAVIGLAGGILRRDDELARMLAGACIGGLLFFTLSEAQMGHFYGVLQPSLAALAGVGLARLVGHPLRLFPSLALLGLVGFLVWQDASRLFEPATVKSALYGLELGPPVLWALAAFGLLLIVAAFRRRNGWAILCSGAAVVSVGAIALWAAPALAPKKSMRDLWQRYVEERRSPDEPLGAFGDAKDSIYYYSNNRAVRLSTLAELTGFLAEPGRKFVVLEHEQSARLERLAEDGAEILDRSHPSHRLVLIGR